MGCCSSTVIAPSDPDPPAIAASAPLRPATVATPTPATPATPLASEHSSMIPYRPRCRRTSTHSTHRGQGSDSTRRDRRKSAPEQPPLPLQASPSQDCTRIRAQTFVAPGRGSHPVPRLPNPGEDDAWLVYGLLMTPLISAIKVWDPVTYFNDASSAL
jgi:hypothetical protein